MAYLLTFLEGITTFLSPCMLPMLPIYVSYFSGMGERGTKGALRGAAGFVLGFTLVFTASGAFAGGLGRWLAVYSRWTDLIFGAVIVLFGVLYMGILPVNLPGGLQRLLPSPEKLKNLGFFSALLFGIIFSVGWTPCVGIMWGSALSLAASRGHVGQGMLLLLCFSAGLGLPFLLSAVLLEQLKSAFSFIKRHYKTVNLVCGAFLVVTGIAMMTGYLGALLDYLSIY